MPLILFVLIVLLIAQVGFWNALGAIVGGVLMIVVLAVLTIGILVLGGMWLAKRMWRDPGRPDSWQ